MKSFIENRQKALRIFLLIIVDIVVINSMDFLSLLLRCDFKYSEIDPIFLERLAQYAVFETVAILIFFVLFKVYQSLWQYAGIKEAASIGIAVFLAKMLACVVEVISGERMPISYYVFSPILITAAIGMIRFAYRLARSYRFNRKIATKKAPNIMIIGAGSTGSQLLKDLNGNASTNGTVKCIIDDNTDKVGKYISGVKVIGGRQNIVQAVERYGITDIIIAIPSASHKEMQEIISVCNETDCQLRIMPALSQLASGEVSVNKLRPVEIEDLLAREQVNIEAEEVKGYVTGKVVLVTGGGGSIGSELCRQIAQNNPKQLVIVDIYENNAYDIQNELIKKCPHLNLVVLIGSVRNTNRMDYIFSTYRPEIVYHAAAHKHVPLMEDSPNEAIKNNVFGTLKTAEMADKYKVKKFVLISSDKAVNPTNIMGASKRICEMIIQQYNKKSETSYVAVRFGNVLGSNGSVIPLFKRQIAEGGPVTITHPDIIRYFMTIPEAVSLVLQAGAMAEDGDIFVLDMGEPIKILDLALNLIRLSGLTPYEDIDIQFVGLRPGEKLYEELLMSEEGLGETANRKIKVGKPIDINEFEFWNLMERLREAAQTEAPVRDLVKKIVPEYRTAEETVYAEAAMTQELDESEKVYV